MSYLFTSESVSEGHPDKIADQISDAILDNFLAYDPQSKVACETLVTTGQVIIAGEVKSKAYVDVPTVARQVIADIGYTRSEYQFEAQSCGVLSALHEQSPDINRGVEREDPLNQGAGDQGMMFGFATDETANYMPLGLDMAHTILRELANLRHNEPARMPYLRPDAKSQVTVEYGDDGKPHRIDTIVISLQHDEFADPSDTFSPQDADRAMHDFITADVKRILLPRVRERYAGPIADMFGPDMTLHINPTGKFVIGGPHGDTGLTGRKIIVDTYGGRGAHGGGAFSGKDPSKVDRSAAYAARHIAKNIVAAGIARQCLVQISYAIGLARPTSVHIDTCGTALLPISDHTLAQRIAQLIDLRPRAIEDRLKLRHPIYRETAAYGHMGRTPHTVTKRFASPYYPDPVDIEVELFTWEKLDLVDTFRRELMP
jgi:S-adenosylmethionine synthetase